MRRNSGAFLGILILVAGLALAAYGYYEFDAARQSLGNAVGKLFTGKSEAETRAVILMIAGGAATLLGAFLTLKGRRR